MFYCGERSGCYSTCNSDSQLSVDSYSGREILSPGTGTSLNKNNMSSNQEVVQLKTNPVLKTQTCNKLILQ